jgi:hypothetical protein
VGPQDWLVVTVDGLLLLLPLLELPLLDALPLLVLPLLDEPEFELEPVPELLLELLPEELESSPDDVVCSSDEPV